MEDCLVIIPIPFELHLTFHFLKYITSRDKVVTSLLYREVRRQYLQMWHATIKWCYFVSDTALPIAAPPGRQMALKIELALSTFNPPSSLRLLMPLVQTSSVVAGAENPSLMYIALNTTLFTAIVDLI